jgi:GNAT superfamily N-acetyltransferase
MIQIVRIEDVLPEGLETLRAEASAEGYAHIDRLARDWEAGLTRFDQPGEALFAACIDGDLAGVGGLTREPSAPHAALRRARRFYVSPRFRGQGAGRALAGAVIAEAFAHGCAVTVNAGRDAPRFWEALGLAPVGGTAYSHCLSSDDAESRNRRC